MKISYNLHSSIVNIQLKAVAFLSIFCNIDKEVINMDIKYPEKFNQKKQRGIFHNGGIYNGR